MQKNPEVASNLVRVVKVPPIDSSYTRARETNGFILTTLTKCGQNVNKIAALRTVFGAQTW